MPKPRIVRALAYHHPGPNARSPALPRREMWVETLPGGIAALDGHPIFQLAPLGDIRGEMLKRERRILKQVRLSDGGPVEALIWHPCAWHREQSYLLAEPPSAIYCAYRPQDPDNRFSPGSHWIGMTRDRVWETGGGERDHIVLGAYVHFLERLDGHGNPIPAEAQGVIPDADEIALGGLAP